MVPKVTLEVSPVTGQKDPSNREFSESSQMVGGSTESYCRCSYPSSCSQYIQFGVYRCLPKRLGSSLERNSSQWPLVKQGGSDSHQRIGAKSCSPGPRVSGALARSKRAHLFRQQYSSILSEQRRRHPFHRNVCSYLENSGIHKFQKDPHESKTCTWIPKCDSRLPIKKGQGHTNRVVPSPTDIQPNLQSLTHTNGRPVYNSSKLQTSNLCISCPKQKGLENRCIEYLLGRPRRLCLLPSSHLATSNSKNNNIPMQDDSTGPRVARDAMVLGSGGSLDQGTPTAPHWKTLLKQPHSNRFHNNVEYLNLHVWLLDSRNPILEDSHLRWQKELRHLRGNPQEKSTNQGGPFMGNGAHRIRWTSPQQLFPR